MKNTILSEKDLRIIEELILKFGRIVSTNDLMSVFKNKYSEASARNRIQKLCKAGWFLRIKRGLYLIVENLSSRSVSDMSLLTVSQAINKDSYISLSSALNYYQMFDQHTSSVASINSKISRTYKFEGHKLRFIKISKKYYFGFIQVRHDGALINMASREKALIDFLYLSNSFYDSSLVFEKIKNHKKDIDFSKLQSYALKMNLTVQRKVGFFLDKIHVNSDKLYQGVKSQKGLSRLTKESNIFNAKWRLYYDDKIIE